MASIDKAAMGWTIAIVAVAVGIATMASQSQIFDAPVQTSPPVVQETPPPQPTDTKQTLPGWDRIESVLDPGIGHETHQLAILLAPSTKVYHGAVEYDVSEPIQLVALHGPLGPGEDSGQPIWTPDGETKFALTFVDPGNSKGKWIFAGNALALHTMKTTPFIADYKLDVEESSLSDTILTGTMGSMLDPGIGHESHSIAIIIPPGNDVYSGILSYSASEPIQLVSLEGPLAEGESSPLIWTPDGSTNFALTFVDRDNQMGSWDFSGNALAVHTMNMNGFTVSYSVASTKTLGEVPMEVTPMVEEPVETPSGPVTVEVLIPSGTSLPGCEETNECWNPSTVSINVGDTVVWPNEDSAAHTVTSGTPAEGPDGMFDSSLLMATGSFEYTFESSGTYDYFCMVHPWMVGTVQVS